MAADVRVVVLVSQRGAHRVNELLCPINSRGREIRGCVLCR